MTAILWLLAIAWVAVAGWNAAAGEWETAAVFGAAGALTMLVLWVLDKVTEPDAGGQGGKVTQSNVITSDVPNHPEYATQRAAELVNQRAVGRNRGPDKHVYVSTEQADYHSQDAHIKGLNQKQSNGRTNAENNGVHVHHVSPQERDERNENGGYWR